MITNTILSAITFIQIVTNWGPVQSGFQQWNGMGGEYFYPQKLGEEYQQVANVDSQEVLRVVLPDGQVVSNILKSTTLRTITKRGHKCPDIIWDRTNDVEVMQWTIIEAYTNGLGISNFVVAGTASFGCVMVATNSTWHSATISSESNTLDIAEAAKAVEWVRLKRMSYWDQFKAWWKEKK